MSLFDFMNSEESLSILLVIALSLLILLCLQIVLHSAWIIIKDRRRKENEAKAKKSENKEDGNNEKR